jgi:hypothetical protein
MFGGRIKIILPHTPRSSASKNLFIRQTDIHSVCTPLLVAIYLELCRREQKRSAIFAFRGGGGTNSQNRFAINIILSDNVSIFC